MSPIPTQIQAVVVYPDRARLTRSGRLALEAGSHTLEIVDLPAHLDPDSVRASAFGSAQARLLGVLTERAFAVQTQVEQVRALEKRLEALQDERRGLESHAELLKQNRANLSALAGHTEIYATALAAGELSVEAQLALFSGLTERAGQLDAQLQELVVQQRELDRQIQKVKDDLDRWRGTPRRESYTAKIEIEVLQAGELTVELSYLVKGAGWQPLYDLRLVESETAAADLEVGYLAQVVQNTGEAWQQVSLTLSTARPALASRLPELQPWFIQPRPVAGPVQAKPGSPAPRLAAMRAPSTPAALPEEAAPIEFQVASVDSSGAAVTYHLPAKVSLPADGSPHKVTVAAFSLAPQLDFATAPLQVEAAYRRAKVTNDSPYTFLPGNANLFSGDEFIGTMRMELVAPQGELELFLGVDDRLQVSRELKRREVDKRLIGGKRQIHYGYEITLENLRTGPVEVEVHDQIPVARHEDIKVRLENASPPPAKHSELNLLDWRLNLAPRQKQTVRFDFTVEFPQAMEVSGLL